MTRRCLLVVLAATVFAGALAPAPASAAAGAACTGACYYGPNYAYCDFTLLFGARCVVIENLCIEFACATAPPEGGEEIARVCEPARITTPEASLGAIKVEALAPRV